MTTEKANPQTDLPVRVRAWEFWRSNQVWLLQLPLIVLAMFAVYVVLKSLDSRIGIEGFGDLFGYMLNLVRAFLIVAFAWWFKKRALFDIHSRTELDLFLAAKAGDRHAYWLRVFDRIEWAVILLFVTYWLTR
jgi:uncharacterized membrane protein